MALGVVAGTSATLLFVPAVFAVLMRWADLNGISIDPGGGQRAGITTGRGKTG